MKTMSSQKMNLMKAIGFQVALLDLLNSLKEVRRMSDKNNFSEGNQTNKGDFGYQPSELSKGFQPKPMAGTPIPIHPKNTQKGNIYLKYIGELGRAYFLRFENLDSVKYSTMWL
jgi:hypothetical protein